MVYWGCIWTGIEARATGIEVRAHATHRPEKGRFPLRFKWIFAAPRSGATERLPHGSLVDTHHRYPVEGDPPRRQAALPVAFG